jgi:soluble lytic murein transglycosylase-like protein
MEQTYWLGRKRASAANARIAGSAEARLAHLELAGRYSVKAAACAAPRLELAQAQPAPADGYGRIEAGAAWLESRTGGGGDGE